MATGGRSGLGRPPLPRERKKESLTCYMPIQVIERLGEIAEDRRTTRNKLMAQVLSEFVERIDRARREDGAAGRDAPAGAVR